MTGPTGATLLRRNQLLRGPCRAIVQLPNEGARPAESTGPCGPIYPLLRTQFIRGLVAMGEAPWAKDEALFLSCRMPSKLPTARLDTVRWLGHLLSCAPDAPWTVPTTRYVATTPSALPCCRLTAAAALTSLVSSGVPLLLQGPRQETVRLTGNRHSHIRGDHPDHPARGHLPDLCSAAHLGSPTEPP